MSIQCNPTTIAVCYVVAAVGVDAIKTTVAVLVVLVVVDVAVVVCVLWQRNAKQDTEPERNPEVEHVNRRERRTNRMVGQTERWTDSQMRKRLRRPSAS